MTCVYVIPSHRNCGHFVVVGSNNDRAGIGVNVRRYRHERGLTQAELAEAAEAADATISRVERGRLTPSVELARRLAEALDVTVDVLLRKAKADAKAKSVRPCERRLLAAVRGLDDARVDDVARAVRLLLAAGTSRAKR